jgi:hypothetical protein
MANSSITGNVLGPASSSSAGLVTTAAQTFAGKKTLDGGALIAGDTSGSAIASGYVGQVLNSTVSTATNVGTSNQYFNATSLTLTAGTWLICAGIQYARNGATISDSSVVIGINGTSGNSFADIVFGLNGFDTGSGTWSTSGSNYPISLPPVLIRYNGTTMTLPNGSTITHTGGVIYLKGWSLGYSAATPTYRCSMTAIRTL